MTDVLIVENPSTVQVLEVAVPNAVEINNVSGTATVVEVAAPGTDIVTTNTTSQVVELPAQVAIELENSEVIFEVTSTTGPTGYTPQLYSGAAPPNPAVGTVGDLYLVNTGATIGDIYQKTGAGWGTSKGNLTGGIHSVNGISGVDIVIAANNITTGVLPIAQVPTGTTGSTVALGNHNHTGVYEPAIATGLTTQYWRGDKTWVVIDKASLGLSNVVNVDQSNASNLSSGTVPIGRIPTGTTGTTVALGNHNHDATYVGLTGTQTIAGDKTFTSTLEIDKGIALKLKGGTDDYVFVELYARAAAQGTRSSYFGYGGVGDNELRIWNELSGGALKLATSGTASIILASTTISAQGNLAVTGGFRVGTTTTAGYVLTADASGNATWQQTANIITPGTTAQYYRGDLTWQTLNAAAVGLGNVSNLAQVDTTTNQTVAGTKSFTSEIVGPTTGNVLKVGDDARIADVNRADHIGVVSQTTPTTGGIVFGNNANNFRIYGSGADGVASGTLTVTGTVTLQSTLTVTGIITGNASGLTAIPAANLTGTVDILRLPTGTTGTTVALGNHAHTGVYEPVIAAGTTAQYWRGDKSWQTLNAAAVGLGNVANVVQVDLTSGQTITGAKVMNNASNVFTGSGAALTALNATQLTTGTVAQARLTPNIVRFAFTTGSEARPTGATYVEWIGPVQPTNATSDDTWTDTSIAVIEDPIVSMPIGTIQMYAASSAPTNWLSCNGAAVSRTTYAALYTLIGTTYGTGDGSTTFNLPNMQGRVPSGYMPGNAKFDSMGETGGAETVTLTTAQIPAHVHDIPGGYVSPSPVSGFTSTPTQTGGSYGFYYSTTQDTDTTGGGGSHENLAPYITVHFIIKVL